MPTGDIRELLRKSESQRAEIERLQKQLLQTDRDLAATAEGDVLEHDLTASELRSVLQTTVDAIITIDRQGIVRSFNASATRLFGYAAEEVIGQNVSILMPEPYHSEHDGYIRRYLETHERRIIGSGREVTGQRKSGELFPIELAVSEFNLNGTSMFTGIIRDITERKRTQDLLQFERDRAQRYLDVAGVMFLALDVDGIVTMVNPKGCEILGYTEAELLGRNWFDTCLPERGREDVRNYFRAIISESAGVAEYFQNAVRGKTGDERTIEWHNAVLRDTEGHIVGTISSGMDITERKEHENEVRRLQREVVDAAALEQERIGFELHDDAGQDLRGLAFSTRMLGDRLRRKGLESEAKDLQQLSIDLEETLRKVKALARGLIHVEKGQGALAKALRALAEHTASHNGFRCEFAETKTAEMPDLGGVNEHLYRIAQEAVSNAARHANPSFVQIQLAVSDEYVTLEIGDDGGGFDDSDPGLASLGLRIMRHRAELIGARFFMESKPGMGTTVVCSLHIGGTRSEVCA